MYMTRPTAPHLVLNGCPICLQFSNPDSPDGGNPKPGGAWALGGWGELKAWFIGQSGSLSPYLPIHISPSSPALPPVAVCPFPLLWAPPLPGFQVYGEWRESSQAVGVGVGSGLRLHWEGQHLGLKKNFLPTLDTHYQSLPKEGFLGTERVGSRGRWWRCPSTPRRGRRGKKEKEALRGHWEYSYFCVLSGGEGLPSLS